MGGRWNESHRGQRVQHCGVVVESRKKHAMCGTKRAPLSPGLVSLAVAATSSQRAAYLTSNVAQAFWHGQANGRFAVSTFSFLSLYIVFPFHVFLFSYLSPFYLKDPNPGLFLCLT